jgi:AcrR family transcriptional regulator
MIDLRVKGDATKIRLLEAAERMIAEKGFEAVSVRDITGLAKANVAAVNYHFGSREGLLAFLVSQRIEPILKQRMQELLALGEKSSLREWLAAWVKPLCGAMEGRDEEEVSHARLLGRCLEVIVADGQSALVASGREVDAFFVSGLARLLPQLSSEEITWRFHFSQGALIHALIHGETWAKQFSIAASMECWVESNLYLFAEGSKPSVPFKDHQTTAEVPKKPKVTPRRQIAEVVASAMEEVDTSEVIPEASEELPEPLAVKPELQPQVEESLPKAPAKTARGKKAKADDNTGELFLF